MIINFRFKNVLLLCPLIFLVLTSVNAQANSCRDKIISIQTKYLAREKANRGNDLALYRGLYEANQEQKALFSGECASDPQALEYVRSAETGMREWGSQCQKEGYGSDCGVAASQSSSNSTQAGSRTAPSQSSSNSTQAGNSKASRTNNSSGGKKTYLHDSLAEAHDCIQPYFEQFGGFANSCNQTVNFTYCVFKPKKDGWTDWSNLNCEKDMMLKPIKTFSGSLPVKAYEKEEYHTRGGEKLFWFACKNGASPSETHFNGEQITGKCVHF